VPKFGDLSWETEVPESSFVGGVVLLEGVGLGLGGGVMALLGMSWTRDARKYGRMHQRSDQLSWLHPKQQQSTSGDSRQQYQLQQVPQG